MRILLAIDFDIEARLLEGILISGHEVVDRPAGSDALIEAVGRHRPDVVIAQGGPETLTPRSLAACDAAGSRIIVLMADELERRNTLALGVVDRLDAQVEWEQLEVLVRQQAIARGDAPQAPGSRGSEPHAAAGTGKDAGSTGQARGEPEQALSRRERKHREQAERAKRPAKPRTKPAAGGEAGGPTQHDSAHDVSSERGPGRNEPAEAEASGDARQKAQRSRGRRERANRAQPARRNGPGHVVTVWGPHGSPGRTTLAIGLAASLANRGLRVVLIDADPYGGAVAQLLGIADEAPGLAAACRLAGADALNEAELDRVSSEVSTPSAKFRVLAGIVNPDRWPELSRPRIRGVIEQTKLHADVVVIDAGFNLERDEEIVSDVSAPRRNAATHTALELSDSVIALAEGTPLGLQRYLRARLHLLECVGAKCHIEAVVNKVRGGATGMDAAGQVRQVLRRFGGIEQVTLLPNDPKACDRAIAGALSVVDASPRSQLARAIGALAERVAASDGNSASRSLVGLSGVEHHQPYSAL
ncbi:nucleotide-binding protein [Gulosibacter molinativorax]|uniref:CobQ/CobB/MinD/ParA nucleotide binding domain-containing protein n=1 Tax=Gulosibacter molinativorax TaxID=256821 RepID=A0ABT7CBG9_9MICO|nr:P-loop NTPase [Gulosibacter molinativorax]MDJ1372547.1 hypothetical protein [Gulosibacter molinativorax]QUY62610.1 Flagellar synthesis regulator FleN [Gulosibacter molinativorax]